MTARLTWLLTRWRSSFAAVAWLAALFCSGCTDPAPGPAVLTAEVPLHLEDHLDAATVEASEVPAELPEAVEWRFDEPQPDWQPVVPWGGNIEPVESARADDALRVVLTEVNNNPRGNPFGGIYVDLPDWRREDWGYVVVRARSTGVNFLQLRFNYVSPRERSGLTSRPRAAPFHFRGEGVDLVADGSVQSYLLPTDVSSGDWAGPWRSLGLIVSSSGPASIDILDVTVIPREVTYADAPVGVSSEIDHQRYRRTLYMHAPGRLGYRVRIPEEGQLDVGLRVVQSEFPVTFRIAATPEGGEPDTLHEETYADAGRWAQRRIDLSPLAGETVSLALAAEADRDGVVALWGGPTLSGARTTGRPNVIFYVIDGAGADYMSVYGYNRRTTANLERLAAEGAVFEHAYSNSAWSKPSTRSFMTSLHDSVLGGYRSDSDPLPDNAVTMAQHLRSAGYQTAVLTTNPYAGRLSSLDRGVDVIRDAGIQPNWASSVTVQEDFWRWREAYPGEPYWVHFQTMDVHWRRTPPAPFAGLFMSPRERATYDEWEQRLAAFSGVGNPILWPPDAFEQTGISRVAFTDGQRALYDELMAHTDAQLGRLVDRLKATGEWEHTLLIVAADHGHSADNPVANFALGLRGLRPTWGPLFRSSVVRIPLIMVWPERIAAGQRFSDPVSMIDMLPTVLDLLDLPMPEVMQGQSLAPLLFGEDGWAPRPVILDEFYADRPNPLMPNLGPGEISGRIEVIDGRWGASLAINPNALVPDRRRPVPLLLYDLWNDPECLRSLHEERPDLVEHYTAFLEAQWEAHQALAQQFARGEESPLTPEQLRTLRSLGYIR